MFAAIRRVYEAVKSFIGNVLFWIYMMVLLFFTIAFALGSVFGAFIGAFGAAWWVLIGGTLMFMIGTWWEGKATFFGKARNFAFIFFCTAALGGFIWLMGTGGDASTGSYLRFDSWRNIWLGLKAQPLAFITFPLMLWGSLEAIIRGWQYLVRHFATDGWRGLFYKMWFSD